MTNTVIEELSSSQLPIFSLPAQTRTWVWLDKPHEVGLSRIFIGTQKLSPAGVINAKQALIEHASKEAKQGPLLVGLGTMYEVRRCGEIGLALVVPIF